MVQAFAIVLGLLLAYNTIMSAIKNYLEARKRRDAPVDELSAIVATHTKMLDRDNKRIQELDERLGAVEKEQTILLRAMGASISHALNGNSHDKLEKSQTEIEEFLYSRK